MDLRSSLNEAVFRKFRADPFTSPMPSEDQILPDKEVTPLDVFLMGPSMSEKFVSFFKLVGFSVNLVGNLVGISGIGCQISGI